MTGKAKPSELELQVLAVLWERGPSTAREVMDHLPDGKARAYTTVLSVMQVMEKKGLLKHRSQGKAHLYRPTTDRQEVVGPMLRGLVKTVFGGNPAGALQCLLDEGAVDREELAAIQALIARHEQESREGQG
jgi:BlaI family penicillinase repressor